MSYCLVKYLDLVPCFGPRLLHKAREMSEKSGLRLPPPIPISRPTRLTLIVLNQVLAGDKFIASVYNQIRIIPDLWKSTALLIVYDEHGGLYDHVVPPDCTADGFTAAEAATGVPGTDLVSQCISSHGLHGAHSRPRLTCNEASLSTPSLRQRGRSGGAGLRVVAAQRRGREENLEFCRWAFSCRV